MSGTIKYCISTENHYFKLHLKYGFKTGGGMIIINMRKHYKPSSKGIFMSLGFLIKKIGSGFKNKGALCELVGAIEQSTLNSYSGVLSLKTCFMFQTDGP